MDSSTPSPARGTVESEERAGARGSGTRPVLDGDALSRGGDVLRLARQFITIGDEPPPAFLYALVIRPLPESRPGRRVTAVTHEAELTVEIISGPGNRYEFVVLS
jgi:hypothetical protein